MNKETIDVDILVWPDGSWMSEEEGVPEDYSDDYYVIPAGTLTACDEEELEEAVYAHHISSIAN